MNLPLMRRNISRLPHWRKTRPSERRNKEILGKLESFSRTSRVTAVAQSASQEFHFLYTDRIRHYVLSYDTHRRKRGIPSKIDEGIDNEEFPELIWDAAAGITKSTWKSPSAKRRKLRRSFKQEVCVWLRVGARTERLGAQSSPVVPLHGFLNTIPYSVHPPHAFTPAMKLPDPPHPQHFQYRPSSAPTPLRTRDVCEAWHLRSVLWYSTPRIVFSLSLSSRFILESNPRFHLPCLPSPTSVPFFPPNLIPPSACREALVENGISWYR